MTQDDIIKMAREAGFEELGSRADDWVCFGDEIERFANLIAAAEREECAQICEVIRGKDMKPAWDTAAAHCTAAIRARGEK